MVLPRVVPSSFVTTHRRLPLPHGLRIRHVDGFPLGEGEQLVDFKIDFLNKIPVIWTVFSLILIGGAIYYLAAQRKKPWEPVVPTGEDLSGIVSIE